MKKLWIWSICIIVIVIIGAFITIKMFTQNQSAMEKSSHSNFMYSSTPTLFLHGYGGAQIQKNLWLIKPNKMGSLKM